MRFVVCGFGRDRLFKVFQGAVDFFQIQREEIRATAAKRDVRRMVDTQRDRPVVALPALEASDELIAAVWERLNVDRTRVQRVERFPDAGHRLLDVVLDHRCIGPPRLNQLALGRDLSGFRDQQAKHARVRRRQPHDRRPVKKTTGRRVEIDRTEAMDGSPAVHSGGIMRASARSGARRTKFRVQQQKTSVQVVGDGTGKRGRNALRVGTRCLRFETLIFGCGPITLGTRTCKLGAGNRRTDQESGTKN